MSCSDDKTVKLWRRLPKEKKEGQNPLSIIRSGNSEEKWIEEAQLPACHDRAIYSVAWSQKTGKVVTTGGDGKIVVFEERWKGEPDKLTQGSLDDELVHATEWIVLAQLDGAHGVFEINHVCWAQRADQNKRSTEEEVIISTGDDGVVKVWTLDV